MWLPIEDGISISRKGACKSRRQKMTGMPNSKTRWQEEEEEDVCMYVFIPYVYVCMSIY